MILEKQLINSKDTKVDISNFNSGIYILNIDSENYSHSYKIVKL